MRTNIVLDDKLVAEAMKLTQVRTKREVVELALREMVARRKRRNVLELVGQGLIAPDYDVRAVRDHVQTIAVRQSEVEDQQVGLARAGLDQSALRGLRFEHAAAGLQRLACMAYGLRGTA